MANTPSLELLKFKLVGTSPLMMNAATFVNPLHPLTKEIKLISGKRKKTDADHYEMARLEFAAHLHTNEKDGPYVPAEALDKCLVEAGKLSKRGKEVPRGITTVGSYVPLEYKGSRNTEEMFGNGNGEFVDIRVVKVMNARLMRCRPIFHNWSLTATFGVDNEIFSAQDVVDLLTTAGRRIGLLEKRPRYGSFTIEKL